MQRKVLVIVVILGLLVGALVITTLISGMIAPDPVDVARHAAAANEHPDRQIQLERFSHTDTLFFGESANVWLYADSDGNRHSVEVVLKRPMWSPRWEVERFTEHSMER